MEIQGLGNNILRASAGTPGKKRPATYFGEPSDIDNYGIDLRKSLQIEKVTQNLTVMGDTKIGSFIGNTNRRMSLQLEKQLTELSAMSGKQPVTIGNQTAMISCWNSVHGKPESDKSPDKESTSPKEIGKENVPQVQKKPLGRTSSDEIRQALKQKHVESMERALRRNSGSVTMVKPPVNKENKMGPRSMSMILSNTFTRSQDINRSMSMVVGNGGAGDAVLKVAQAHENSAKVENWAPKKQVDENSNFKSDLVSLVKRNDTLMTSRQSSYPGAYQGPLTVDKRSSVPISGDHQKHVRFTIEPTGGTEDEVQY